MWGRLLCFKSEDNPGYEVEHWMREVTNVEPPVILPTVTAATSRNVEEDNLANVGEHENGQANNEVSCGRDDKVAEDLNMSNGMVDQNKLKAGLAELDEKQKQEKTELDILGKRVAEREATLHVLRQEVVNEAVRQEGDISAQQTEIEDGIVDQNKLKAGLAELDEKQKQEKTELDKLEKRVAEREAALHVLRNVVVNGADRQEEDNLANVGEHENGQEKKQERYLRALLKFYFYVPFKWKDSMCSFHLIYFFIFVLQIVKLSLVTRQMYLYGNDRAQFKSVVKSANLALRHLLLENWDDTWETPPYPPAHGDFAVYTINDLESGINYAVSGFYNAEKYALGYYKRISTDSMKATIKYFNVPGVQEADVDDGFTINEAHFTTSYSTDGKTEYKYNITDELENLNLSHSMKRLLSITLDFTLHFVRPQARTGHAQCLDVGGKVRFSDLNQNGQVEVDLDTLPKIINCAAMNVSVADVRLEHISIPIGRAVLTLCVMSIVLTVLTGIFGVYVFLETRKYMKTYFKTFYEVPNEDDKETDLPKSEYFRFVLLTCWDIPPLISDSLTITGTHWLLFHTEMSEWQLPLIDFYTVILGIGCILAWLSMLRYLKVHSKFQLLFRTLYLAIGEVTAYMICITVLFVGYWISGYVVLGPYHVKFHTPSAAAETLLTLINGDEIFATVAMLDDKSGNIVYWFARLYIGTYVAIYTVVLLNLLIAFFTSAYDTIKTEQKSNQRTSDDKTQKPRTLKTFIEAVKERRLEIP